MRLRDLRNIFFCVTLALSCIDLFAQNNYLDSLENVLRNKSLPDSERMETIINIGNAVAPDNPALAKQKYLDVYKAAQEKNDHYYMGMAMSGLGKLFGYEKQDSALYYYLRADSFFRMVPSQVAKESAATNKSS